MWAYASQDVEQGQEAEVELACEKESWAIPVVSGCRLLEYCGRYNVKADRHKMEYECDVLNS
ncbi:hypothetical protein RYU24_21100 [Acinetobacter variabilis]|nr:hypothetical protein RYU24_21100 [Acinetobacter variabilis]